MNDIVNFIGAVGAFFSIILGAYAGIIGARAMANSKASQREIEGLNRQLDSMRTQVGELQQALSFKEGENETLRKQLKASIDTNGELHSIIQQQQQQMVEYAEQLVKIKSENNDMLGIIRELQDKNNNKN